MAGKKKTYGTVFPEAVEKKLLETAAEKGISVSDLIRDAVAKYFGMLREAKQDKPVHGGWRPLPKTEGGENTGESDDDLLPRSQ